MEIIRLINIENSVLKHVLCIRTYENILFCLFFLCLFFVVVVLFICIFIVLVFCALCVCLFVCFFI